MTGNTLDLYPDDLKARIDELNEIVYEPVNNGVYKTGFAKTQEAYDEAVTELFKTQTIWKNSGRESLIT